MPNLLQKIEANAAAKLDFPEGCKREEQLARYKRFLKVETHRLKILHRSGAGGLEVCRGRAAMLDILLRRILGMVEKSLPQNARQNLSFALVATGGYGRGELNPFSDIDILFLHDGRMVKRGSVHPYLAAMIEPGGLLYALYDIGLKVGHKVMSVEECILQANEDMQSKTALLESRFIAGDQALHVRLDLAVVAQCVRGHEAEYITARLEDQAARRSKFGDSACMQEPNIKNGCGGLRDFQNLFWMAFVKSGARTINELVEQDYLAANEARQLKAAYDFMLGVRTELHYHTVRATDVLTRNVQPAVARHLGYTDRSPTQRLEKFMRVLYVHMRNVYLISRTVEQRLAIFPQPSGLAAFKAVLIFRRHEQPEQVVDGFRLVNGEMLPTSKRVFADQPRRLMRAFLHAQKRGLKLHPDLVQLMRQSLSVVNREFINDPHVHQTFLEILNHRGNVSATLRAMHEVDLLGKFLPEFGRLTCLVQHEFYHQYAADEHTLMCLRMLDRVWEAGSPPFSRYAPLFHELERPYVLYLALLLHDVGKSENDGGHATSGAVAAGKVARRLGLESTTTQSLKVIIQHHLLLAEVSQRRDLDDPGVIRYVAERVRTPENLTRLTLHTFADAMGTSGDLWNDFKDTLLWTLYQQTLRVLGGETEFQMAEEKRMEALVKEVRKLSPRSFHDEEIDAHFKNLPRRYTVVHPPNVIFTDLTMAHRFMHQQLGTADHALVPVVQWHNEPDRGYTTVKVCTWDRAGLFCKITGALTAAGLNILNAQIFSRGDGIILDTFLATDARTGKLVGGSEREVFERILNDALNGDVDLEAMIRKLKPGPTLYRPLEGERIPTVVHFDNETSDTRTAIDVETEDRVGLLYAVSHVFGELGLDISLAKILTEKGAASDTFYVAERSGGKVTRPERLRQVEQKLRAAILRI